MASTGINDLSLTDTPRGCTVCSDVMVDNLIFWQRFAKGIQTGCLYCKMIIGAVTHFNLIKFVLSADEIAQLRNFQHQGSIYDAAGRQVGIAINVHPARQKENWKSLRINMRSYVAQSNMQKGWFTSRTSSPVVQFYTQTGMLVPDKA
jgi:hypothetical protein